ncbi:hypothetical protein CHUAL_012421 [Chamberlinius hualienensis]
MNLVNLLNYSQVKSCVSQWLQEDCPSFDFGGYVVGTKSEVAVLLAKSDGVLAGCPFFQTIFSELNCEVEWQDGVCDGKVVGPASGVAVLAHVSGRACDILRGERVALNCIARASGIATESRKIKQLSELNGWKGKIAGTRKTTPGFRMVEKYALLVGGADTHRHDLSSMVMLKDNHIWSVGSITKAVEKCRSVSGFSLKIEVECRSLNDAIEAATAGCDIIMLDNFSAEAAKIAAKALKSQFPKVIIEVSGGIDVNNISDYLSDDTDVVSIGQITQGYKCVNFSLKILQDGKDPWNKPVVINQ